MTITSSTAASASSGSSGPRPVASRSTRSQRASRADCVQNRCLALDERAHLGLEPVGKRPRAARVGARGLDQCHSEGLRQLVQRMHTRLRGRRREFAPVAKSRAGAMAIIGVGSVIVELHL